MGTGRRLLFGPLAALLLAVGVALLPLMVPGYDPVRQTVSEIGEVGSPAQLLFTILLCAVGAGILVFAWGLRGVAAATGRSRWPAWLSGAMALSAAGVGVFSFPHPLHNVFGISELIGYQAPLVLALAWRRDPAAKAVVWLSAIMAGVVWVMIVLNLSSLDRHGAIFAHLQPIYGLVQRGLFAAWFGWCAWAGLTLFRTVRQTSPQAS
jgi:hypothetical membrane protein